MRWLRTFMANWLEARPVKYRLGRRGINELWSRDPRAYWTALSGSWRATRRAERVVAAAHADEVRQPRLRFSLGERLRSLVYGLGYEAGRGFAAADPRHEELEAEVERARAHARVYEDQWRFANEDLRAARAMATELKQRLSRTVAERDDLAAGAVVYSSAPSRARRGWWPWGR